MKKILIALICLIPSSVVFQVQASDPFLWIYVIQTQVDNVFEIFEHEFLPFNQKDKLESYEKIQKRVSVYEAQNKDISGLNKYALSYINQKLDEIIDTLLEFEVPQNIGSFPIPFDSLNIKYLSLDFQYDYPISNTLGQEKVYLYNANWKLIAESISFLDWYQGFDIKMENLNLKKWIYYFQVHKLNIDKNSYLRVEIDSIELGDNEIIDREILDGEEISNKYIKKSD